MVFSLFGTDSLLTIFPIRRFLQCIKENESSVALGGNALGNTLPEQMMAVKSTAKALCDLIEEGHQVVVVHGNGPQVGMINNAMAALSQEDARRSQIHLSLFVLQ